MGQLVALHCGDVLRLGQSLLSQSPLLLHVGVASGFAWADTTKNGMTVLVTARNGGDTGAAARAAARAACAQLAAAAWALRERFDVSLAPLEEAVARVGLHSLPGAIFVTWTDQTG
jgi:microcystin degradation protein MlrC